MWTNYFSIDLKLFQQKHAQHLNHVSCDLISHKKILLLESGCSFCKQKKDAVLPGYCSSDTPELHPGLKNCNFLQNLGVPMHCLLVKLISGVQNKLPDHSLWNGVHIITVPAGVDRGQN